MRLKKIIFQVHKILGLATGVVVFIVAITGCCWTFKDEIESLYSDYKTIEAQDTTILTPTEAKVLAKEIFPNKTVHGTIFGKSDEVIEVIFYDIEPEFYQSIFINPYSREIIHIKDHLSGFFAFVLKGHVRLWLPRAIGEEIVGVSILLFIIILISGFIIWLPKKSKNLKQRLKFSWKKTTRWKRKNFDLHSILGFYVCSLALILALTGLVMSYDWFQKTVYLSFGGDKNPTFLIPKNETQKALTSTSTFPIDRLLIKLKDENPNAKSFEIHYPYSKSDCIYVEVTNSNGLYYDSDFLFFDQNTLKEITSNTIYGRYENTKIADKILRMNYDIHIGAIGGITGKIIAFLVSLLTASLPLTGVLLWYGRNYKKKKP
ncbi:PepSY-associated TM helix domain-containing protein [Aquimarina longa]|uniref:PepSY-associated TM helix domain-containing protein n=1 Tax=Aquimarina longa TaxID=1080221 RepID=UPI000781F17D|nr:PepSY-associated TM helix domain-containing protein [Aquimarina longa]